MQAEVPINNTDLWQTRNLFLGEKAPVVMQKKEKYEITSPLYGECASDIDFDIFEKPVHRAMVDDLSALKSRAADQGYVLSLASGYRSFNQQLSIWNDKASGERAVLDSNEAPLDISLLTSTELVYAILRWSALPGASRHHWGSDFDVYEQSAVSDESPLQLTCSETCAGGKFESFYCWLEEDLATHNAVFYRPYIRDIGGVAPEPWHISYRPLAEQFFEKHSPQDLRKRIEASSILLKKDILENFEDIYARFFLRLY